MKEIYKVESGQALQGEGRTGRWKILNGSVEFVGSKVKELFMTKRKAEKRRVKEDVEEYWSLHEARKGDLGDEEKNNLTLLSISIFRGLPPEERDEILRRKEEEKMVEALLSGGQGDWKEVVWSSEEASDRIATSSKSVPPAIGSWVDGGKYNGPYGNAAAKRAAIKESEGGLNRAGTSSNRYGKSGDDDSGSDSEVSGTFGGRDDEFWQKTLGKGKGKRSVRQ